MHINWLYIAVYSICGYECKPNLSHKNIYCFFFVYKSNYSWSTLLHLKIIQLSKYLQMIWTRKYFHIKIKIDVYCQYSDKYSLLNLINFCIHSLRKHSKILKYSTFLTAKTQVVQFEKKMVKIKIFSSLLI